MYMHPNLNQIQTLKRKSCLDGGSHGDGLVGVDRLGGGAAEDVLARLLDLGHPDEKKELFK